MADPQISALFAATLRTKSRPLVPVPDDAQEWGDKIAITDAGVLAKLASLKCGGEALPDSHDEWRDLNARPPG